MSDSNQRQLAAELKAQLKHFTGDLERYRHSLFPKLIYTPGIKHLAEAAGAYWLLDVIASHLSPSDFQAAVQEDARILDLHFWNLALNEDSSAVVTARVEQGEPAFVQQDIPFTDFPLKTIDLWVAYDGQFFTLYLPSER